MMNVLLINFPKHNMEPIYPFTLGIIAAMLKQQGWRVRGVDLFFEPADRVRTILQTGRIDLVAIDLASDRIAFTVELCREMRQLQTIPVVAVGEFASLAGADLFTLVPDLDAVIRGDAEQAFSAFCENLRHKRDGPIPGLLRRTDAHPQSGEWALIKNLDDLPWPDRDLFPVRQYALGMLTRQKMYAQILTSRGCVHGCSYCAESVSSQPYRARSPHNVVGEMAHLMDAYGIREFHMEDKNLIGQRVQRMKDLCALIREKLQAVEWQCAGVIPLCEMADLSVLDAMASAGCYSLTLGVESFSAAVTQKNRREQSTQALADIVRYCKDRQVEVCCSLIIGLPGQTLDQVKTDIQLSRRFDFDFIHYNIFKPLPQLSLTADRPPAPAACVYQRWQMAAYARLLLKCSVLRFVLRRLARPHNWGRYAKKMWYYLFSEKKVHVA